METDPFLNDRMQPVLKQSLGFIPSAPSTTRVGGQRRGSWQSVVVRHKWVLLGGAVFIGLVVFGLVRSGSHAPPSETDVESSAKEGSVRHEAVLNGTPSNNAPVVRRTSKTFGNAASLFHAMRAAGLSDSEANAIIPSLSKVIDPKKCYPQHMLWMERDGQNKLLAFEYEPSDLFYVRAEAATTGEWVAKKISRPVKIEKLAKSAVVETTVANALESAGIPRSFASAFIEAFDSKITFGSDTHCGDQMRLVVEKESVNGKFLRYHMPKALEWRSGKGQVLRSYWFAPSTASTQGADGDYFDAQGRRNKGGWIRTPLHYDVISSRFDPKRKHPVLKRIMPHTGVDFAANTGTPVMAAADGTIGFVGNKGPNGNLISIRHGKGFETHYAHLSRFARGLKAGMKVRQRQLIGYVGSTGRSTAPHLHFALEKGGKMVDPLPWLHQPGEKLSEPMLTHFRKLSKEADAELDRIPLKAPAELRCGHASTPAASDL